MNRVLAEQYERYAHELLCCRISRYLKARADRLIKKCCREALDGNLLLKDPLYIDRFNRINARSKNALNESFIFHKLLWQK